MTANADISADDWCSKHLEPYKAVSWDGWGDACVRLMAFLMQHDRFVKECGGRYPDKPAHPDLIPHALLKVRPICCYVPASVMDEVYKQTLPGGGLI